MPEDSLLLSNAREIARSLSTEFTENEFVREAMLFHGATPQTAKQMIYALLKEGYLVQHKNIFVRTSKLYASNAQAKPLPAPKTEPKPELPRPMPAPPNANVEDLARLVLSHLETSGLAERFPAMNCATLSL